jgi:hypothetical protein
VALDDLSGPPLCFDSYAVDEFLAVVITLYYLVEGWLLLNWLQFFVGDLFVVLVAWLHWVEVAAADCWL